MSNNNNLILNFLIESNKKNGNKNQDYQDNIDVNININNEDLNNINKSNNINKNIIFNNNNNDVYSNNNDVYSNINSNQNNSSNNNNKFCKYISKITDAPVIKFLDYDIDSNYKLDNTNNNTKYLQDKATGVYFENEKTTKNKK